MTVAICKLDNNHELAFYRAACPIGQNPYRKDMFIYIGDGVVHSIDGIVQNKSEVTTRLSFFKLKSIKNFYRKTKL